MSLPSLSSPVGVEITSPLPDSLILEMKLGGEIMSYSNIHVEIMHEK